MKNILVRAISMVWGAIGTSLKFEGITTRSTCCLYVLIASTLQISAQMDFKQIVPANPTVASIFKHNITPVNEYSGLPGVSIPLCTVSEGAISIPVSLDYHTGGIQVSEESGMVGLGWSLNTGGTITRSVSGVDDFATTYGYLVHSQPYPNYTPGNLYAAPFVSANSNCEFPVGNPAVNTYFSPPMGEVLEYDYMPDTFYYNFNGYSGSFMFYSNGDVFMTKKEGLKIELTGTGPLNLSFTITTEEGTVYEFTLRGNTSFPNGNLNSYTSTWYLTSITDISGNEVTLSYKTVNGSSQGLTTEPLRSFTQSFETPTYSGTDPYSQSGGVYQNAAGPWTVIDDFYLQTITFDSGELQFDYSADGERADLKGYYLESLKLVNNNSTVVKQIDFDYSYFGNYFGKNSSSYSSVSVSNGDFAQEIAALAPNHPDINLRLRLDGITENALKTHRFEYHGPSVLPNKTTFSQDYWGYFNNADNDDSFIPELRDSIGNPLNYSQYTRANRLPNETFAKYFSLKKIIYPTKGWTEFDYELNTYEPDSGQPTATPLITTVEQDKYKYANEFLEVDSLIIDPYENSTLYLDYTVTLRGWNNQYSKPSLSSNDFDTLFYVQFLDLNGNELSRKRIPSSEGYDLWTAWDPNNSCQNTNPTCTRELDCGGGSGTLCTSNDCENPGSPAIVFTCSEEWQYNNTDPNYNLTDDKHIIKVYFDDLDGKLYGQATVRARWEDIEVDEDQQYSIGGGLRVKSIVDKDSDGSVATRRNFDYHYTDTVGQDIVQKSYGRLKTIPKFSENHRTVYQMKYLFKLGFSSYYDIQGMPKIAGSASSSNVFTKDAGSYVGYDQVEITYEGSQGDMGKTIKTYHNLEDLFYPGLAGVDYIDDYHKFPQYRVPHNGYLKKVEEYKRTGTDTYFKVRQTENFYEINGQDAATYDLGDMFSGDDLVSAIKERPITLYIQDGAQVTDCDTFKFQYHSYFSDEIHQTGVTETQYDQEGYNPVVTSEDYYYDNPNHLQRTRTSRIESDGSTVDTYVYYPDDISSSTSLSEGGALPDYSLVAQLKKNALHRIATPVQTVTKRDNSLISVQRTEFDTYDGIILPAKTLASKTSTLEERLLYEDYVEGRPVQLRKKDGMAVSYLWGYDGTYPIAKIENATYSDIATALSISVATLKTYDESNISAINGLRSSNPEFKISTYTYNPLVGMISMTDPKGYTTTYQYDGLNRLKWIKDHQDYLLSDYQYHYESQN